MATPNIKGNPVNQIYQLNGNDKALSHPANDKGTINVDSAHDGLSIHIAKGNEHDNKIFSYTSPNGDVNEDILSRTDLFIPMGDIPETGNLPSDNKSYVYDTHEGACLRGPNQGLDSANSPSVVTFIDCMIKKFLPPGTSYSSVTGLDKNKPEMIYMFQLYNSKLNVDGTNVLHRLDYSVYTNYDILVFMHVYNLHHTNLTALLSHINSFLQKVDGDKKKNETIQLNKYLIIQSCILNYLWQNLMNYCKSLKDPGPSHPEETLTCLRKICFTNVVIPDKGKSEIDFPKYKIGFTDTGNLDITAIDLNNNTQVQEFIDSMAHMIYTKVNGSATSPARTDNSEYVFITAQHMSASGILALKNAKTVSNREGTKIKNAKEKQIMNNGLAKLMTGLTSDQKIYLYQILKFQGDSSHLVYSYIIKDAHTNIGKQIKLKLNGSKVEYISATNDEKIEIVILTGEKPLTCRAITESISIQALNFVVLNIGGGYSHVLHISDPCISVDKTISKFLNLFTIPIKAFVPYNVHISINDKLKKAHESIIVNYNQLKEKIFELCDGLTVPLKTIINEINPSVYHASDTAHKAATPSTSSSAVIASSALALSIGGSIALAGIAAKDAFDASEIVFDSIKTYETTPNSANLTAANAAAVNFAAFASAAIAPSNGTVAEALSKTAAINATAAVTAISAVVSGTGTLADAVNATTAAKTSAKETLDACNGTKEIVSLAAAAAANAFGHANSAAQSTTAQGDVNNAYKASCRAADYAKQFSTGTGSINQKQVEVAAAVACHMAKIAASAAASTPIAAVIQSALNAAKVVSSLAGAVEKSDLDFITALGSVSSLSVPAIPPPPDIKINTDKDDMYYVLSELKYSITNNKILQTKCSDLSKENIFNKITLKGLNINIQKSINILETYNNIIEYFSSLKENLDLFTDLPTGKYAANFNAQIEKFKKIFNFLRQTYQIFSSNPSETFVHKDILMYPGIKDDYSSSFKDIYNHIENTINVLKDSINSYIADFYTSIGDIYYIKYNDESNKFVVDREDKITTYIFQPVWSNDSDAAFVSNFTEFLNKKQGVVDDRTQNNLNKKELSDCIANISSLLYKELNISTINEINEREFITDTIIQLINLYTNIKNFSNCVKTTTGASKVKINTFYTNEFLECLNILKEDYNTVDIKITNTFINTINSSTNTKILADSSTIASLIATTKDQIKGAQNTFYKHLEKTISGGSAFLNDKTLSNKNDIKEQILNCLIYTKFFINIIFNDKNDTPDISKKIINLDFGTTIKNSEYDYTELNGVSHLSKADPGTEKYHIYIKRLVECGKFNESLYKTFANLITAVKIYYGIKYIDLQNTTKTIGVIKLKGGKTLKNIKCIKKKNKTIKKGGATQEKQELTAEQIDQFNRHYKNFLLSSDKEKFDYNEPFIKMYIDSLKDEQIFNSSSYEYDNLNKHIASNNEYSLEILSNILTSIYFNINHSSPILDCLTFSQLQRDEFIQKSKTKVDQPLYKAFILEIDKSKSPTQSTIPYTATEGTTIGELTRLLNTDDKLDVLSKLINGLYFYNNGKNIDRIFLDVEMYKLWCDRLGTKNYNTLNDYIFIERHWFKHVDYGVFLNKTFDKPFYRKKEFDHDYIYSQIAALKKSKKIIEEEFITKEQIYNYKQRVILYKTYGIIKEYSMIDFILKILKIKININFRDTTNMNDLYSMFDIYYMYFKSIYKI
jgi:hypothetical protein